MDKLITSLDTNLGAVLREQLDTNFQKIQAGVDGQSDALNKQITDLLGNVAPQDQNEVTQARIDAHGNTYGTLKSREDVTQNTAETALSEERATSVEVQDARTNSSSQTYPTLKERMDNQENDLNNSFNDKLAQISAVPETFTNLAALQSKYPNGSNGIMVTADTGHKYIWANGNWTDAGVYQSVGIADGSVTKDKIDRVGYNQIVNSFAVPSLAFKWSGSIVSVSGDDVFFSHDPASPTVSNFGVTIPVKLEKTPSPTDTFYLNFDYISSALANDPSLDKMEVWITKIDGTILAKISPTFFYASLTKTSYQLPISATTILNNGLTTSFGIMIATHNIPSNTTISNFRFNDDNGSETIDLNNRNNKAVVKMARKSSAFSQNYSLIINGDVVTAKSFDTSIKPIIEVPYFGLDITKTVYFELETYIDPNTAQFGHFWIGKVATTTPDGRIQKGYGKVTLEIHPNELSQKGVTKDGTVTITIGDGATEGLIVNHISISNKPIDGDLDKTMKSINDNSVDRHIVKIGQSIAGIDSTSAETIAGLDFVTPKNVYSGSDGILKRIKAYVSTAGSYTFKIAKIDQNSLIVDSTNYFSLSLVSGYNDIDVENQNMQVPDGAQVFMNLSSGVVYKPDDNHLDIVPSLIRDNSHPTTNPGYSGQMLYDAGLLIPFNYEVIDKSPINSLNELRENVNSNNQEIAQLSVFKDNVLVKSPSGKSFRLVVSEDGTLSTVSQVPYKVAIFGNSLTSYDAIGGFGLAASNQNNDWFAGVKDHIINANNSATVYRGKIGGWEGSTTSSDRQNYFDNSIKPNLSSDTDLVIVQAGDNVNTADKATNIYSDSKQLILNIKQVSPEARVFWVASWFVSKFANVDLIASIKNACSETGANFIDITGYSNYSENNSYIGAKITKPDGTVITVTDPGYAAHPGDRGHKIIADTVNSYLGF
ncbi:SGNH/GDSL hydrolase family protein [Limosilactobacillus fermentum]|uniref:SGNH/GDSL hydrolase family protein n=1 Tax=Limosilactobacillus fermentum TaxID=1613 RepID=UPI0034D3995F